MKMVEESDRIWGQIDSNTKSIGDHCIRITKLEQDHIHRDENKNRNLTYLLAGIVVIQFVFMMVDLIW